MSWQTTLSFKATHLLILDAIPPNSGSNTAIALSSLLATNCQKKSHTLVVERLPISQPADFGTALQRAQALADAGGLPMLHFDGHADEVGLRASNNQCHAWTFLWPNIKAINVSCRNNLCLTFGVCKGLHSILDAEFSILHPAAALAVVAAQNTVSEETIRVGFELFFERLFEAGSVDAAFEELKAIDEQKPGGFYGDFRLFTAQSMFEKSAARYIVNGCLGKGATERIQRLINESGYRGPQFRKARQKLAEGIRGPQALRLKKYHETFLMIDRYPELANRLAMDYVRFESWVRAEYSQGRRVIY